MRNTVVEATVCTLYEGDYHYGVGALVNSLYRHGYRGIVWVGYRKALPPWAHAIRQHNDYDEMSVAGGCAVRFVPLTTDVHLTNFKPDFMLQLWEREDFGSDQLFYFDPDIVVRCNWLYFEEWASAGIALCEDVNSPLPISHPLRAQWRRIYERAGLALDFQTDFYVNGGFLGIARAHRDFLVDWQRVQQVMAGEIGSLKKTGSDIGGREEPFAKTDQDALNITLGLTTQPVSLMGKEGMDILPGGFTMSHSLGYPKPWNTNFIRAMLRGYPPSESAKAFFRNVEEPIRLYSHQHLRILHLKLLMASMGGRFYRRA